jgi:hypothetical protein
VKKPPSRRAGGALALSAARRLVQREYARQGALDFLDALRGL